MINFHSYKVTVEDEFLNVCADYYIQFENKDEDETYCVSFPTAWREKISNKFETVNYYCYRIYFTAVKNENANRVTDYKKIWGLMSLPTGMKDGFYHTATHKVYFGVDKSNSANLSLNCNIMIFKPNNQALDLDKLFYTMKTFYDGKPSSIEKLSQKIYQHNRDSYVVAWYVDEKINLSIYGMIKKKFSDQDFRDLIAQSTQNEF